jgi:hypothetical protein
MVLYKNRTFCRHFATCAYGLTCARALTEEEKLRVNTQQKEGTELTILSVYVYPPDCHKKIEQTEN